MKMIILIAIGGGVGAVCRYLLSKVMGTLLGTSFPFGTLVVNIIGAFLIGFIGFILFERTFHLGSELRALIIIGLLGGFTTFSSFSYETVLLLENQEFLKMGLYLTLSVALCLVATWLGLTLGRKI